MIVRVDLHIHSGRDPRDNLSYSVAQVIDRAASVGLHCLAIADHGHFTWRASDAAYARARGLLLIPAIEARIQRRDVVILNAGADAERLSTFAELRAYRAPDRLIIAPHPFFPIKASLKELFDAHAELFDAVELSPCYLPLLDVHNNRARRAAARAGLPLICNTDAHNLWQLGGSYTEIEVPDLSITAVCAAIRAGRCRPVCRRLPVWRMAMFIGGGAVRYKLREWFGVQLNAE